jgi:hypothetical protein
MVTFAASLSHITCCSAIHERWTSNATILWHYGSIFFYSMQCLTVMLFGLFLQRKLSWSSQMWMQRRWTCRQQGQNEERSMISTLTDDGWPPTMHFVAVRQLYHDPFSILTYDRQQLPCFCQLATGVHSTALLESNCQSGYLASLCRTS